MAVEINTGVSFDIGPALAALDRLGNADASLRAEMIKNREAVNSAFVSGTVQNQVAVSNAQAAQQADLRATTAAIRSAQDEVKRLTQAQRELEQAQKKATNTDEVKRLTGELEKNRLKILEAKAAVLESKDAAEQERAAVASTMEARRQALNNARLEAAQKRDVAAAAKAQAAAEQAVAAASDKAVREAGLLVQFEKQLTDLAERRARATTRAEAKGYTQDISAVNKQIADIKGSTAEDNGGFFSGLLGKVTAATGGLFAFNSLVGRVKQGLDDYGAIKGIQATLNAVAGSAADGGREFAYLKEESDALGLSLVPTGKAYAGLFAATKEANISVGATRDVFEGVTSAAKVLNLTGDDTNGILLALQQIASKGVVSAEELRGQMGERLPTAFGLAAKAMGLTTAELDKQLRAGRILASDFLPKFGAQLKATYGDATADAAEQVGSNLGRINTFFSNSSARLGATFAPFVALVAQLVTPLKTTAKLAEDSAAAYFKQADASKALEQTVTPLLARYEQLNGQTTRNAAEQRELDSVIQQLAKTVPGAVTQFNEYGKALGLNGAAVRKFIEDDRNLTRYRNTDSLQKNRADLIRLVKEQEELTAQLNNTVTGPDGLKRRQVAEASSGGTGGGGSFVRTLSQAESDKITADYVAKLTRVQDDIRANLEDRQQLRGYSPLLPKVPTTAEVQGLIEKQKQIIKDLQDRQLKATQENKGKGADFLLGAGGLDEQLDKANKELARLEGKISKTRKASDDALQARLRALFNERQTLSELASKAAAKQADDETERVKLNYEVELAGIEKIRKALVQRELDVAAAARKRGGEALVKKQGANADGVIDGVQAAEIDNYGAAAAERLTKELARIERERAALLLSLQKEGDQVELERLKAAFNEQVRLHVNEAGVLLALEAKYQRDREALLEAQATRRAQHEQKLSSSQAAATAEVYGAGTGGQSIYEAQFAARQQQLDADKTFAEKRLDILKDNHSKEADEERAALAAQLLRIRNQQQDLNAEQLKSKFSLYRLVLGSQDTPELRAALDEVVGVVQSSLSNILQAEQQAAQQKASDATQQINELTGRIAIEQALHDAGSASNLAGLRQELAEQRQIRKNAQKEQRESAQAQVILDGIVQSSNLITSISNIFAGSSKLDLLLPGAGTALAIGLSSVLVGAFLTSKVAAYEAAGSIGGGGSYFKGGVGTTGYTGDGNPHDESRALGRKGYTYHKQEYILPHEVTQQFRRSLLEPLHQGRFDDIDWWAPEMQALRPQQTISLLPDLELPEKLRAEKKIQIEHQLKISSEPIQAELAAVRAELSDIKASNREMANRLDIIPLPDGWLERDPVTGSTHRKVV